MNTRKQMETRKMGRRELIHVIGAAGAAALAYACGGETPTGPSAATTAGTTGATGIASTNAACGVTPSETVGPYPSLVDLFRSDIREGKSGVPLALTVKVVNANSGCAAVPNVNVEIWQCDATGNYSQYGSQAAQTYLRGMQTTDANGQVSFTTIYPGWYQGRATHIHIEVTRNGAPVKATQIAFPETVNATVYASGVYASRGANPTSNLSDGIFADSLSAELVTPVGDPSGGYAATCQVGISV